MQTWRGWRERDTALFAEALMSPKCLRNLSEHGQGPDTDFTVALPEFRIGGILGNAALQPKLQSLHIAAYRPDTPSLVRTEAQSSYPLWNRITLLLNLALISGVITYNWNLTSAENPYRFGPSGKFRG